jgi:hypothetical protein
MRRRQKHLEVAEMKCTLWCWLCMRLLSTGLPLSKHVMKSTIRTPISTNRNMASWSTFSVCIKLIFVLHTILICSQFGILVFVLCVGGEKRHWHHMHNRQTIGKMSAPVKSPFIICWTLFSDFYYYYKIVKKYVQCHRNRMGGILDVGQVKAFKNVKFTSTWTP